MGDVYLGHDTILDRAVAIKLIAARAADPGSRERFLTEARAIARLSHPNVVAIYRVGETPDGRPFLVQELIRGKSLDQIPLPMPWRQVCELAVGISRGLDAAHRRGILHRDVKPANVMLDEDGRARLLDFGLAKLDEALPFPSPHRSAATRDLAVAATRDGDVIAADVTRDPTSATSFTTGLPAPTSSDAAIGRTEPGSLIGTPRYTSPESWRGDPATVKSDLYSLGALLYELLAGDAPYPATALDELQRAVCAGGAAPPATDPRLAAIVMRCLAVDPAARPASAAELAHALESLLVDAPAAPEGNPYRGLRPFDAAHSRLFFGRGADVGVLVDRLRTESLVIVAGDSGIGKSSVCHAGVVPAVLAGALDHARTYRAVTVALGRTPWTSLCDALAVDELATARALRQPPGTGLLLVFDQLEELVTLARTDEAARVAALLAEIADGVPGVKALLAVRGDFLTRVAALPALSPPMTRGLHLLRVLSRDDLHEAIVGPARTQGVRFETDAMVASLVAGVEHDPGALPLLQFTLAELWQTREHDVIPARALAALGGVEGALAGHADRVLLELGAPERLAARGLVLRLVSDDQTRAVRTRDELVEDDPVATAALESLVRGRLVVARDTVSGTPTYELAHEALIRSWTTLRDWLAAAAGDAAARKRLAAAATEWHRLAHRHDLLWLTRRQLDEVHALEEDATALGSTERAFLAASRAQLRRRRVARVVAYAAVPLAAIVIYAAVRYDAARRRDRDVDARLTTAAAHRDTGDRLAREAADLRTRAYALFEANGDGEPVWADARARAADADSDYRDAERELEGAFLVDATRVRTPLARILWSRAELAEATYETTRVADLLFRLGTYDPTLRRAWDAPGHITLTTATPATFTVHASSPTGTLPGRFDAKPIVTQQAKLDVDLPAGSYVAVVRASGDRTVRFPFVLGRGERYSETLTIPSRFYDGYVYVPAGRFLFGDAQEDVRGPFLHTAPLSSRRTDAFWIGRDEMTFGGWLEFLRTLSPTERAPFLPQVEGQQRALRLEADRERFTLVINPSDTWLRASEGAPLMYSSRKRRQLVNWERAPVLGITAPLAATYAAWLDRTGKLPGARLCSASEWERAARGADGRRFPHGATLKPHEANFDLTYERTGFGPDEVGTHPASNSPFDVRDLAGNASEMVTYASGQFVIKGGSYWQGALTAWASNTSSMTSAMRTAILGFRVCASAERVR